MKDIQIFNTLCDEGNTVGAVFSNTNYAAGHEKTYTYRIADAMTCKEGDLAIVEKDGKYSFVTIAEVHAQSQLNAKANYRYKWIVAIVDTLDYYARQAEEDMVLAGIACERVGVEREKSKDKASEFVTEDTKAKISRL